MSTRGSAPRGFALVAAVLAILILSAAGILVFTVSTQDIRISSRTVGEKKALAAANTGIHRLTLNFDPANLAASAVSNVQVDSANDPSSQFTVTTPAVPASGPLTLPLAGYSIGGGQQWGQVRYAARVTGANTRYNSNVPIDVQVGYGPIEITTTYR